MARLIRVDRNGTKYYEGMVACDRCGGAGGADVWAYTGWKCYKCDGTGKMPSTWKEYTPEYAAKLEARREAKRAKWEAEHAEEIAKEKAEREAREAQRKAEQEERERRIAEEKAKSQYVGEVGQRMEFKLVYIHTAWFEVPSFSGFGTETMHIHIFKDADGNKFTWKTANGIGDVEEGAELVIKGTIKEHKEYNDEKQTVLTRCKIAA